MSSRQLITLTDSIRKTYNDHFYDVLNNQTYGASEGGFLLIKDDLNYNYIVECKDIDIMIDIDKSNITNSVIEYLVKNLISIAMYKASFQEDPVLFLNIDPTIYEDYPELEKTVSIVKSITHTTQLSVYDYFDGPDEFFNAMHRRFEIDYKNFGFCSAHKNIIVHMFKDTVSSNRTNYIELIEGKPLVSVDFKHMLEQIWSNELSGFIFVGSGSENDIIFAVFKNQNDVIIVLNWINSCRVNPDIINGDEYDEIYVDITDDLQPFNYVKDNCNKYKDKIKYFSSSVINQRILHNMVDAELWRYEAKEGFSAQHIIMDDIHLLDVIFDELCRYKEK